MARSTKQSICWRAGYEASLSQVLRFAPIAIIGMIIAVAAAYQLYKILPSGFVPQEDQGYYMVMIRAPEGSSLEYTSNVAEKAMRIAESLPEARPALSSSGYSFNGNASNLGIIFCPLKDWHERKGHEHALDAVIQKVMAKFMQIPEATVAAFNPPALEGIGNFGGFVYELMDLLGRPPRFLSEVGFD